MSRPSTPKRRRSNRSSGVFNILSQSPKVHYPVDPDNLPLETQTNTERFEKLSDSMEELEANMSGLQQIHESLSSEFNESFASFLYGLSMTMWCVHFPGRPSRDQWEKVRLIEGLDDRIDELRRKLKVSKDENDRLRKKLTASTVSQPSATSGNPSILNTRQLTTHIGSQTNASSSVPKSRKLPSSEDDTNLTNESFVANPSTRVSKIPVRRGGMTADNNKSTRIGGPNLNQPPRYMRGLFEGTNNTTRNSRRIGSGPGSLRTRDDGSQRRQRPPFR
ncbi:DASH complex subunit Dam1p [[Candida] anglica]|uniref:DASH complex subunit DAM1 n=1 Tax=[Candida] anglica TaxID=148631 RepID=A0ABP0EBH7_9ASCO